MRGNRDEPYNLDDERPSRAVYRKTPTWAILLIAFGVVLGGCAGLVILFAMFKDPNRPEAADSRPPEREPATKIVPEPTRKIEPRAEKVIAGEIGKPIILGDVTVTIVSIQVTPFSSRASDGNWLYNNQPELLVTLHIANTNANRLIEVSSQFGSGKVSDDLGNNYKELRFRDSYGAVAVLDKQMPHGSTQRLRSEKPTTDVMVFEKPVLGASSLTVEFDAANYGGTGTIRLVAPRSVWEPVRKK